MAPRRRQKAHQQHRRPLVAQRRKKPAGFAKEKGGNVEEWVYRFLGNLAAIEENKNRARKHVRLATVRFAKPKKTSHRRFRSPTPFSWDRVATARSRVQRRHPGDSDDEVDVLLPPRNAKPVGVASANSSDNSGRERTLLQRINRYIRAGIAEGKRRAKRYVQKALAFALETGYLVPADREGKLLRVSHSLVKPVSETKPGRKRKSFGKLAQKRKQQQQQHRSRSRKRRSAVGRRKSIAGQGDESRQKRQARKQPSEESSVGAIVEDARKTSPSSGGSRNNRTSSSSRSPSRSGRHQETMSASEVERKMPVVVTARPRSAPNTRGPV